MVVTMNISHISQNHGHGTANLMLTGTYEEMQWFLHFSDTEEKSK